MIDATKRDNLAERLLTIFINTCECDNEEEVMEAVLSMVVTCVSVSGATRES